MGITIIRDGSQKNIDEWEQKRHPPKTFLCERCGCLWKAKAEDIVYSTYAENDNSVKCPQCSYFTGKEYIERDPYDDWDTQSYSIYV